MASLDYSTMGTISGRVAECNDLRIYDSTDDQYRAILRAHEAPASDFTNTMPSAAGQLLNDASSIAVTQLDVNGASSHSTLDDNDELVVYDSVGGANKKISISSFKTETNEFPSATSGQLLVADSTNTYTSQSLSGDATISDSAVLTLAADCVDGSNIADDAIDSEHIVDGAVDDAHLASLTGVTDGQALASSICKFDSNRDLSNVNALSVASMSASGAVSGDSFEFGTSTNRWKFSIDASNNLKLEFSSDSGSTYAVKQVFQSS